MRKARHASLSSSSSSQDRCPPACELCVPSVEQLEACIAEATEARLESELVQKAGALAADIRRAEEALRKALESGAQLGWDRASIEWRALRSALELAAKLPRATNSAELRRLERSATAACDLRRALADDDWPEVERLTNSGDIRRAL